LGTRGFLSDGCGSSFAPIGSPTSDLNRNGCWYYFSTVVHPNPKKVYNFGPVPQLNYFLSISTAYSHKYISREPKFSTPNATAKRQGPRPPLAPQPGMRPCSTAWALWCGRVDVRVGSPTPVMFLWDVWIVDEILDLCLHLYLHKFVWS
jgi:hypothetical protein